MTVLKINNLQVDDVADRNSPFYNGPAEFLCVALAENFKADVAFQSVFGESIYPYKREDFSIRELPGIRIYNDSYTKEAESWFVVGDITTDIVLPPSIRRNELQQLQDSISSAVLQHLRRPSMFEAMSCRVPGLNELGRVLRVDKSLGFMLSDELVAPLTQLAINFKIDLRIWDDYLTETYRTKDSPFCQVLGDLRRIQSTIEGLRDSGETEVTIQADQSGLDE